MQTIKTISAFHRFRKLPPPHHPLLSVIDVATVPVPDSHDPENLVLGFYTISVKRMEHVHVQYGQQPFDFDEGIMSFLAPNQVLTQTFDAGAGETKNSGWVILIHPDFLWNTPLAGTINRYDFWDYSLHHGLFLSPQEESVVNGVVENIRREYLARTDKFSKQIISAHLEVLLTYADRFYQRQFITREKSSHEVLERLERLLQDYFLRDDLIERGLPTVQYVADALHLSPSYLSSLLRALTGRNTQQHIHEKLIERAKERLSTTNLTVSEIAYEMGFEHLPSFSKLFKAKTSMSPMQFRATFT
ncbi:helix-turn-helix domain-containing protein [Lewinella sp. IMCC34191]|uniref:helix-turn-helix domain-containing protein n=1 Tax=Lewinella sp. IMCC34191 TaxID=2259172 RepID=UPI000E2376B0|nr:helix-turn-helix domain-containing protein [Lewinella sp. IMCC34191]